MSLMTISAAGFGRQINWGDDEVPPGHKLSFKQAFESLKAGLFVKLISPEWLFDWAPTKKIREAREGYAEYQVCPPQVPDTLHHSPAEL